MPMWLVQTARFALCINLESDMSTPSMSKCAFNALAHLANITAISQLLAQMDIYIV